MARARAEPEEERMLSAISQMDCSVTLADPGLPDCPLIGCSDGFEALTGYLRADVLGQNCRFLSRGLQLDPQLRLALRTAVVAGTEFIGILPNKRRSGEVFRNLLHMTTMRIAGHVYLLGIQSDVTGLSLDMRNDGHVQEIQKLAERIFAANVEAWVQLQAREFHMRLPPVHSDARSLAALEGLAAPCADLGGAVDQHRHGVALSETSFLHIPRESEGVVRGLRRSASDTCLGQALASSASDVLTPWKRPASASTEAPESSGQPAAEAGPAALSLRYCDGAAAQPAAALELTFAVGQEVRLAARLEASGADAEGRRALLAGTAFSAQPPLPEGLRLEARTGEIRGTARAAQARAVHVVAARVQATGPGGLNLGLVELASCLLSICVEDLSGRHVCGVFEEPADERGRGRLTVTFAARPPRGPPPAVPPGQWN